MIAAELNSRRPVVWFDGRTVPTTAVIPLVASMIFCSGASAQRCTSRSRNQSSDVYPWIHVSGSTTRSDFSVFPCSIARITAFVLLSKSPLVVLIWPIVTRITGDLGTVSSSTQSAFEPQTTPALYSLHHPCGGVA